MNFFFWRGKSHKLGHVATLSGLVLGPILMTSLRIVIFWPQICKGNILPVQLIPKVISFSIWTQFYRSKHCQSSTLTDWNQTSTTSQKWLNFKRKPLYLIRTIKELTESYSFLDITNPHSVISVLIPIIILYHYRQALKLNCFNTSIALCRLIFAFAGAAGSWIQTETKSPKCWWRLQRIIGIYFKALKIKHK